MTILCKYATLTERRWGACACKVVECRAPSAVEDAQKLRWRNFKGFDGARFAVDENFQMLTNADYIERRSMRCNESCPFYQDE